MRWLLTGTCEDITVTFRLSWELHRQTDRSLFQTPENSTIFLRPGDRAPIGHLPLCFFLWGCLLGSGQKCNSACLVGRQLLSEGLQPFQRLNRLKTPS